MMTNRTRRRRWKSGLLVVGIVGVAAAVLVPVGAAVLDTARARAAEKFNAPDVLIADPLAVRYPDPLHVALPDGRTFRLAHVIGPELGSPERAKAMQVLWQPLTFGGNRMRGLRVVGTNAAGETMVELWGLQPSFGGCGNTTWSERRAARIPRWRNLTWQLVASGFYRLESNVEDRELIQWQDAARREGQGVWSDPTVLRQVFDLEQLDRTVRGPPSYGEPKARDRRLEAAELLLRADAATYAPRLLSRVKNPAEKDVFVRIRLAQLLDNGGHKESTQYLMDALRGRVASGLGEYELNSVVSEYQTYWNVQPYFPINDHAAMVKYYDTQVRAGGTGS